MNEVEEMMAVESLTSLEAEQTVLGAVLIDPAAIVKCAALTPEKFYQAQHKIIFRALLDMAAANEPIDVITVSDKLEARGEAENAGGLSYLIELQQNTPSAANIARYAKIVNDRYIERGLLKVSSDIEKIALAKDGGDVAQKLNAAADCLAAVGKDAVKRENKTFTETLQDLIADLDKRLEGVRFGLPTGLPQLDEAIGGLPDGNLIVIAARPSMGKTVLAENIARFALKQGKSVHFQSYEMSSMELARRSMAAYEFVWREEESLNPKEQAEIYAIYKNAGILTADEIRADLGKEPLPEQEQLDPNKQDDQQPEEQPNQEAEKLGKSESPMSEAEAAALIEAYLLTRVDGLAEQIAVLIDGAAVDWQADDLAAELNRVAKIVTDGLDFGEWSGLSDVVEPIIRRAAEDGAVAALLQVMPDPAVGMVTNIRSRAVKWAHDRAAEMVGMKWVGGELIQNPAAEWQITEGTREMIRAQVVEAMRNGDSVQELAGRLKESHAFSNARARTIARTETAMADGMGNLIGWEETGLVAGKQWITAEDDKVSEICNTNGKMGVIGLHEHFAHGGMTPPAHPNCRCTVVPVLADDMPKV